MLIVHSGTFKTVLGKIYFNDKRTSGDTKQEKIQVRSDWIYSFKKNDTEENGL